MSATEREQPGKGEAVTLRFGRFALDARGLELSADGVRVAIEPRALELLHYLVVHRDRVVAKTEIFESVWHGRIVSDSALTSAVRSVRKALDESGRDSRFIRTYYSRGLRFVAEVEETMASAETERPGVVPEPAPGRPSVAILPFDNMSNDPAHLHFADGMTEDLITELSKFHEISVVARRSSFAYKGRDMTVGQISEALGARYVVEGSVRCAAGRVRVNAQLIDAVEGTHIWAERYDGDLDDIFAVQDEVTRAIVMALVPHLSKSELERAARKPPESLDAWENHQRALWHMYQFTEDAQVSAITFFERAIALDGTFADAHAGLSYALGTFNVTQPPSPRRDADLQRACEAGRTAVRLNQRLPFGWIALARSYIMIGTADEAISAAGEAVKLNPNSVRGHFMHGHALWHAGRPEEGIASFDRALELSPFDPFHWVIMGGKACALALLERYDEAIEWSRSAQRQSNAGPLAYLGEICALGHLGRADEAGAVIRRARRVHDGLDIGFIERCHPITNPRVRERFVAGFRKAGFAG